MTQTDNGKGNRIRRMALMKTPLELLKKASDELDTGNMQYLPDIAIIDGEVYTKPPERDHAREYLAWHLNN